MNRYNPIEYQTHTLLFLRPDARMGFIDYTDRTSIKSLSALIPDQQFSQRIEKRETWYCSSEIKCYDARDFIDSEHYAAGVWLEYRPVTIAFTAFLWAVDLADEFSPKLSNQTV